MSGLPVVLAAAIWLGGNPAALVTTPLIGACAVRSFGDLAGMDICTWSPQGDPAARVAMLAAICGNGDL
jgi:hypothetical protein